MRRNASFILTFSLLLFVFGCNGQDKSSGLKLKFKDQNQVQDQVQELKNDLTFLKKIGGNNSELYKEADTVLAVNAPTRMIRRIRITSNGNLLIAAYTDVILYDGLSFSKLPKVDGLESIDAFDALEDQHGNIWIASTHQGVFRYDGIEYKQFTTKDGLVHNRTIDLFEDKKGNIWISTLGGISRYDGKNFRNFTKEDGLADIDANRIIEDKNGKIWISTRGDTYIFDGEKFTSITTQPDQPLINNRHIIEDKKGHIWLGGIDGIWRYDGQEYDQISKSMTVGIHEDKYQNIWAISQGDHHKDWSLVKYSSNEHSKIEKTDEVRIMDQMLFGIGEDIDGTIWIGTLKGIMSYDGRVLRYFKEDR